MIRNEIAETAASRLVSIVLVIGVVVGVVFFFKMLAEKDRQNAARVNVSRDAPVLRGSMDFSQGGHSYTMFYGIDCRGEPFTTVTHRPDCPCEKEEQ